MTTIKIVLDERRKNDDEIYTVKLRVTHNRQQKYYLTGFKMTKEEFNQTMKDIPAKKYRNNKVELEEILLNAKNVCRELKAFSFIGFENKFLSDSKPEDSLFELFQKVVDEKLQRGKISTAINYRCSMKSLKKFKRNLTYVDITPGFLYQYEEALLDEGKKITTVGIYMRPLRAILNEAISFGYFPKELYPFGRKKYIIPEGRNPKKALEKEDFHKIWNYSCIIPTGFEARSKDFFILSYLCQGANFKDLLLMRKEQLSDTEIHFIREKTKESGRSNPIIIRVPLLDEAKAIIQKWGNDDKHNPFVFNFITEEMSAEEIYKTNMQFVKITNKYMSQIAESLGIEKRVTTYVARHQFSKAIIDGGESVEYLSECLGHKNIRTTQNYIQRFSMSKKIEAAIKNLIPV